MNSLYGNYRTRTFSDIFPSDTSFIEGFRDCPLGSVLTDEEASKIWFILASKYMNSHICYSDENQFKFNVYQIVYSAGPTYCKKVELQDKLRALTDTDILKGTKVIYNHAYNPASAPSTDTLTEIETINDQNTANTLKSKMQGYTELYSALNDRLTEDFLHKFKKLFLRVVEPQLPLWYITNVEEEEE